MPAERKVPDKETLTKWIVDEGLSRQEIVDRIFATKGHKVTVQAISTAASRFGIPRQRNRWDQFLPWRVLDAHGQAKEAILLRCAGRRQAGLKNPPDRETWLDSWLAELEEKGRPVVAYYADTEEGFHYHPRVPEDGDGEWDLIRRPEVQDLLDERASDADVTSVG